MFFGRGITSPTTNPLEQPIDLGTTAPSVDGNLFNHIPGGNDMNINDSLIDLSHILDSFK